MRKFIIINWYRLITATAMLIFSIAFFIFVVKNNSANAGNFSDKKTQQGDRWIVANQKGIFEVTWNANEYPKYKCKWIFNENGK
jgi:hypothetical protein